MDIDKPSLSRYKTNKSIPAKAQSEARPASEASKLKGASTSASDLKLPELKEGQLVKGQIVDHRYNEITIQLEPDKQLMKAKLSGDVPLSIGQEAQFQVTEEGTDRLVLKYIPADTVTATDTTIQKALTSSGLPLIERNKALVEELLNHRMPIDKQTLQQLVKLSVTNREASPLTLVLMYKNQIPMTAANIRQFETYQNGTHQLLNVFRNITDRLVTSLQQNVTTLSKDPVPSQAAFSAPIPTTPYENVVTPENVPAQPNSAANAINLNRQLLDILFPNRRSPADAAVVSPISNLLPQTQDITKQIAEGPFALKDAPLVLTNAAPVPNEAAALPPSLLPGQVEPLASELFNQNIGSKLYPDAASAGNPSASLAAAKLLEQLSILPENDAIISDILSTPKRAALLEYLKEIPDTEGIKARISEGFASIKESLEYLQKGMEQSEAVALKLLPSPEYRTLLEEAFFKKWTLTPEKLAKKTPVSDLYQNLQEDLEKLSSLTRSEKEMSELSKLSEPVKNARENLQFLKDLNEMFTYLQLPVQLKDRSLHSDLYVFTRKKALNDKRENLSVLLHLELEHLGPLNVQIQLNHSYIQAKFYIEDKEAYQLIEKNLPLLEATLQKKGYQIHAEMEPGYEKPDFRKDFIEQNSSDQFVQRYTFDIRT